MISASKPSRAVVPTCLYGVHWTSISMGLVTLRLLYLGSLMYASNLWSLVSRPYSSSLALRNMMACISWGLPLGMGETSAIRSQFSCIRFLSTPFSRSANSFLVSSVRIIMRYQFDTRALAPLTLADRDARSGRGDRG